MVVMILMMIIDTLVPKNKMMVMIIMMIIDTKVLNK